MSTLIEDFRDLLHAAYARLFPERIRHNAAGRHHRAPGRPAAVIASTFIRRAAADRALRAECERMASLLDGIRRGRAESVFFRAQLARLKSVQRVPARARFAGQRAVGHVRTAARSTADAVAATAGRLKGAHRHTGRETAEHHDLVVKIMERAQRFERQRARGERSWWAQGRQVTAW